MNDTVGFLDPQNMGVDTMFVMISLFFYGDIGENVYFGNGGIN